LSPEHRIGSGGRKIKRKRKEKEENGRWREESFVAAQLAGLTGSVTKANRSGRRRAESDNGAPKTDDRGQRIRETVMLFDGGVETTGKRRSSCATASEDREG
jgi:hypothetical protein